MSKFEAYFSFEDTRFSTFAVDMVNGWLAFRCFSGLSQVLKASFRLFEERKVQIPSQMSVSGVIESVYDVCAPPDVVVVGFVTP